MLQELFLTVSMYISSMESHNLSVVASSIAHSYVLVIHREVIGIKEREYGVDHPSVAIELNNLAVSCCHLVRNIICVYVASIIK